MKSRRGLCATTACLLVLVLVGGCPGNSGGQGDSAALLAIGLEDHVLGRADAPVTVIEYGDLQCPICGRFAAETFPTIRQNYIDTGKVRYVYRHFPLTLVHAHAEPAAEAAECAAAQGDFWGYHDVLLAHQSDLAAADLADYAVEQGLDAAAFASCTGSGASAARVDRDVQSGQALGVISTPTFFIGEQRVVGFRTAADFSTLLDAALAAAAP